MPGVGCVCCGVVGVVLGVVVPGAVVVDVPLPAAAAMPTPPVAATATAAAAIARLRTDIDRLLRIGSARSESSDHGANHPGLRFTWESRTRGYDRPVEPREEASRAGRPVAAPLAGGALGGPGDDFVVVEWSDSGSGEWEWIAPPHVHHGDDEAWYVLEGVLRFRLGDEQFEASAGTAVLARRGTPHAYGNARREPARYLLVVSPRIMALVEELHAPRDGAGGLDYAEIFRKYDSELLS
jgi:mannose-6-phosphate isomerase-like protein (cupin superfamily)